MRRNYIVGDMPCFWLSSAEYQSIEQSEQIQILRKDRLSDLICLIENFKAENGVLRKKPLLRLFTNIKGFCFLNGCYYSNTHDRVKQRDCIAWLLVRYCELPISVIAKEFNITSMAMSKGLSRIEDSIIEDNEVFNLVFELVNEVNKNKV